MQCGRYNKGDDFVKLATTTGDFDRVCSRYIDRIRYIYEAGFRYVDLSLYVVAEKDELVIAENWRETAQEIRRFMQERKMKFVQAHAPSANPLKSKADFAYAVEKTLRAIAVCGFLEIPNLVVHTGWRPDAEKDEWFAENRAFFRELIPAAEEHKVNLLHENGTGKTIPGFYLTTGTAMREFSAFVNHPRVHSCWDTGHALLEGDQYEEILALGDDLYGVHIHDNRGEKDEHLAPFLGIINMAEIMHALIDVGYKGTFTLEADSTLRPGKYWVGNRREFPKDPRFFEPNLEPQRALESFLYKIGKYILQSYGVFEE